jgi:hypothetical protein
MKVRGGIAGYFRYANEILALARTIKLQDIHTEKRTTTEGFLRGDVLFKDGSRLHFRELITTEPSIRLISYTYHYMNAKGTVIFRYDDSDHFLHLPTAPHHKHTGKGKVIETNIPNLESVLNEIEGLIK